MLAITLWVWATGSDAPRLTAVSRSCGQAPRNHRVVPPRVAANMAAELGVEAHALEQVLDRYLRAHLADMAEVKIDLR